MRSLRAKHQAGNAPTIALVGDFPIEMENSELNLNADIENRSHAKNERMNPDGKVQMTSDDDDGNDDDV